jgi:hypothetical protein
MRSWILVKTMGERDFQKSADEKGNYTDDSRYVKKVKAPSMMASENCRTKPSGR